MYDGIIKANLENIGIEKRERLSLQFICRSKCLNILDELKL